MLISNYNSLMELAANRHVPLLTVGSKWNDVSVTFQLIVHKCSAYYDQVPSNAVSVVDK
jgi:hypothetical protein